MSESLQIKNRETSLSLFNSCVLGPDQFFSPMFGVFNLSARNIRYHKNLNTLAISHTLSNRVHLINCNSGKMSWFDHHKSTVRDIKFNGNEIITSSWDGTVRITDLITMEQREVLTEESMGRCPHSSISRDGRYLVSCSYDSDKEITLTDNRLRIWELKTGKLFRSILLPGNHLASNRNASAKFFQNKVFAISDSGVFCMYNSDFQLEFYHDFFWNIKEFLILKKQQKILIASVDGKLYVFDIHSKNMALAANSNNTDCIDLTLHPTLENIIIESSSYGNINIWQWPDFKNPITIETNINIWKSIVIGNKLWVGGTNSPICVFDISNLTDIKLIAKLNVYKTFYFLKLEGSQNFYTNAPTKMHVFDDKNKIFLDRRIADNIIGSNNNLKVLHDIFETSMGDDILTKMKSPLFQLLEKN